jgi:hypothetical protein
VEDRNDRAVAVLGPIDPCWPASCLLHLAADNMIQRIQRPSEAVKRPLAGT